MFWFKKDEGKNKIFTRLKNLSYKLCDFTERIYWDKDEGGRRAVYTSDDFTCKRQYNGGCVEYCGTLGKDNKQITYMLDAFDSGREKEVRYDIYFYDFKTIKNR